MGFLWHQLRPDPATSAIEQISGPPISSNQRVETHAGVGNPPQLRRMEGRRMAHDLRDIVYPIPNDKFELTLRVQRDEILFDKTGQVMQKIAGIRQRWADHWAHLAIQALNVAGSTACHDGANYYSTSHSEHRSGTQSNLVTVSGLSSATAPTGKDVHKALWAGIKQFSKFKDDVGEPAHSMPTEFVLQFPPDMLEGVAAALNATQLADGTTATTNVIVAVGQYRFNMQIEPRLTATDEILLHVADGRALRRQVVTGAELRIEQKAEGSDYAFDTDGHEYGILTYRGLGLGDWKSSIKLKLAV